MTSLWTARCRGKPGREFDQRHFGRKHSGPRHELFDLQTDPLESKNVAEDPNYADVLAEFRGKFVDWQKVTNDRWIVKYRYE